MDTTKLFENVYNGTKDTPPASTERNVTYTSDNRELDISRTQWLREYIKEQEDLIASKLDWCIKCSSNSVTKEGDKAIVNILCEVGALTKALSSFRNPRK